jgi:hypothetical protein
MVAEMKHFMVTFPTSHPLHNNWIEVVAFDENSAREAVFENFGPKWAFMYEEARFDASYFPGGRVGKLLEVF